ncbi:unnamed protein product [Owenia fusiformis]|uniref:Uncharacterized protein n=1 Tax=Owenia fusiformis TaxID=6347 RepID=A0A8J1UEC3_OWEFU|nr:unnamed protein product [Owenia fusiformis]
MGCGRSTCGWMVDILFVLIAYASLACLVFFTKPPEKGFMCSDTSIHYPYIHETVSIITLLATTIAIPSLLIIVTEVSLCVRYRYKKRLMGTELRKGLLTFLWGFAATACIVYIIKMSLGSLRPHFIQLCQPKYFTSTGNCTGTYMRLNIDYVCTNNNTRAVWSARQSFPSGHAALGAFSAAFLFVYAKYKWSINKTVILVPFVQMLLVAAALHNAVLRIVEHQHRHIDVWAGSLIGVCIGIHMGFTVVYVEPKDVGRMRDSSYQLESSGSVPSIAKSPVSMETLHVNINQTSLAQLPPPDVVDLRHFRFIEWITGLTGPDGFCYDNIRESHMEIVM